jgi:hypothetical protein
VVGRASVLARSIGRGYPSFASAAARISFDETRGIDFLIKADIGEVRVAVRHAVLVNELPMPRRGPHLGAGAGRFAEVSVGPWDRVEVVGLLEHEVTPEGEPTAPGRGVPTRPALRGTPTCPLLIRVVEAGTAT